MELQHNLIRINDPAGQMYLENEYGSDQGLLSFNRVIRQRQGKGERYFEYQDITQEFDKDYTDIDKPAHQTNVTERNGQMVHYIYNMFGNLLLREEEILIDRIVTLIRWRYRYNADGVLIGIRTPEGRIAQYYYGRDDYLRRNNITDNDLKNDPNVIFENLTDKKRMAFGNLLAVVRGGKFYDFSMDLDLSNGVWGDFFPPVLEQDELLDIVTKFTYEQDFQQILTASDPRFTRTHRSFQCSNNRLDY